MARDVKDWNRFELKYRLRHDRVPELVRAFGEYVVPDPYCTDEQGYPIYSVYSDTPEHTLFWEKVEGLKYRRKVRFRRYGTSPEVFVEIKQRVDRTLQKRRVRWPVVRVMDTFFGEALRDDLAGEEPDRVSQEVFFLWRHYGLRPNMGISYRRRAFFASNESDLRITFDHRVQYHPTEPDVEHVPDSGKALIDPSHVIMEIKFDHTVPLWLCAIVRQFGLEMIRMSKYCTAIDREYHGGQLT